MHLRHIAGVLLGVALVAGGLLLSHPSSSAEDGAELVGAACPDWPERRWVQGGPLSLSSLRGRVVLLRFFTDSSCPYCRETAPALRELDRELGPRGLVIVGMYTPKPSPRRVSVAEVRRQVKEYGFEFPIAVDDDWGALRALWLKRSSGAAYTSSSILIDQQGIVRHVHPGGALSKDSADPAARAGYRALRETILALLSPQRAN